MESTGKFDQNGEEIFAGDKVIKVWGMSMKEGETIAFYQIHTINVQPAHMMANNEMHDDGGGKIFCLGKAYNFWKGEEVIKLKEEILKGVIIPEDTYFYFDENDIPQLRKTFGIYF